MGKRDHQNIPTIPEMDEFLILASSVRAELERGKVALALQGVREIEARIEGWRFAVETKDRRINRMPGMPGGD